MGCFVVAIFALNWMVSIGIYKWRRYDEAELHAAPAAE